MIDVVLIPVFNAKIINNKRETDLLRIVFEYARCVAHFVIPVDAQPLFEQLVGKHTSLWKAVHTFADFEVDKSVLGLGK